MSDDLLAKIDAAASLDFLAALARHKSYSQTDGERSLVEIGRAHV